jgi:TRAP-type C4-dicarboxylate transport system substrate-binding protein
MKDSAIAGRHTDLAAGAQQARRDGPRPVEGQSRPRGWLGAVDPHGWLRDRRESGEGGRTSMYAMIAADSTTRRRGTGPMGLIAGPRTTRSFLVLLVLATVLLLPFPVHAQEEEPTTLTLAIANGQGEPSQPAIDAFIEQVGVLSDGSIEIEPIYHAGDLTEEGFEHGVAVLVGRGEADLGLNATRAWDLAGVTSLQALQAPFLITSGELAAAVAEGDVGARALAGMADHGVVGLALWPEDLRHPFALGDHAPYLSPTDFDGATILVQPSALSRQMVAGLGADLYVDGDREADAAAGLLHGAESGLLQGHTLPGQPTATGDVTFYPKFQVITANAEAFAALTPEQQEVLRAAAEETRRLAIEARTSEADAAAAWCDAGGTIVLAGADDVASFEAAVMPIFESISTDPLSGELITEIQALKSTIEPAPGAVACSPATAIGSGSPSVADVPSLELVATWDVTTTPGMDNPGGMDFAADGSLVLANTSTNEILVLDSSGHEMRRFGESGSGEGQLDFLRDKSDPGSAIGGVAVAADGSIYVADSANRRVQQFDADGGFVRSWGSYDFGREPGTFIDPIDVADAPDGTIYVVDDQRDDIQRFTSDGSWLSTIGEHGTGDGQLNFTGSIYVDGAGNLLNADWDNERVQAWGPDEAFLWSLGSGGSGPGQFVLPGDVGVDALGNVYVTDRHRVQVFDADHSLIASWTAPGTTGDDELYAVSVSPDGLVYVTAPWVDRIYVLRAVAP